MYEKKTVYTPAVYRVNNYEYRCSLKRRRTRQHTDRIDRNEWKR